MVLDAGALLMHYLFAPAFLLPDPAKAPFPFSYVYYDIGYISAYFMALPITLVIVILVCRVSGGRSSR